MADLNDQLPQDQLVALHPPVSTDEFSYGAIDPLVTSKSEDTATSRRSLIHSDSYHALVDLGAEEDAHDNSAAWRKYVAHVIYLSEFAILGSILRVVLGRFFGGDCEKYQDASGFFPALCLTHSGKYGPGGAIFIDLPANLLGSFIMGMLNPLDQEHTHAMPWFHRDHILQTHDAFVTGLRTGICGSLTTFSSWNTQMVVMLNGTDTVLGRPQFGQAILGYLLGFFGAAGAYIAGSFLHNQWTLTVSPAVSRRLSHQPLQRKQQHRFSRLSVRTQADVAGWTIHYGPLILCIALFVVLALAGDDPTMVLTAAVSPLGGILRWKLGRLNECQGPLEWMPWGTFAANMLAVALSVATESTHARLKNSSSGTLWLVAPLLSAMQTGFGGSLSTVSTWLKEIFTLPTTLQATSYALGTVLSAVALGLTIYSSIIDF